uniref:Uncharacterized protein n=1 Tax=Heterorhabditis bacteriophora TaxID=37862 RepID=A0A1I7XPU7_HETBA
MILRLLLLAVQAFIIVSVDPLVRVEGDQNNSRLTIARNKHISSTSQNEVYANFLRNTYSTEIDLLFVTPPPQRTTVAYKKQWKKKREEKDNLKVVEEQDKNYIKKIEIKEKIRTSLRLVTLSRATTTPLPPFKHTAQNQVALHHEIISFRPAHYSDMDQTSGIRFPAQPWQIPPRNTERFTEIGIDDGLIEIQSGNTHPQNPFLLTTVPPMNTGSICNTFKNAF